MLKKILKSTVFFLICLAFSATFTKTIAADLTDTRVIDPIKTKKTKSKLIKYDIVGEKQDFKDVLFSDKYTNVEGVLTFRGNNYRSAPSYGYVNIKDKKLEKKWDFTTSTSSWGGGAGWTGQPAIIKWDKDIKNIMNIKKEFKNDDNFVEVIYASLDGNIYFFDLKTGKQSRDKIKVGNPIKGSLSIDPRGYPLLYLGEGIPENGTIGYNIYSLIDGKRLHRINGLDSKAYRGWGAFDSSALINGESDTLIAPSENGMLYLISLNTKFDLKNKKISISPKTTMYRYKTTTKRNRLGIENSILGYKNLLYFADNSGYIQCFDMQTQLPVWVIDGKDDTDSTMVLEEENGVPYIYSGNEVDFQGNKGVSEFKKINALTGKVIWKKEFTCLSQTGDHPVNGGMLGSPILGKNDISGNIIINLARYKTFSGGLIASLDKDTGKIVWKKELKNYVWSSSVDIYTKEGKSYIIQCNSVGEVLLIDGLTGKTLDTLKLNANIESSPAIYNNNIVIATRGQKIYNIKIK